MVRFFESADSIRDAPLDPGARRAQVAAWDRVLHRIFSSGLVVAVVLNRGDAGDDVRDRLRGVVDDLDQAVREIRDLALELAILDRPARPDPTAAFLGAVAVRDAKPDGDGDSRRRLRRIADTAMFAYAEPGTGFFRVSDRALWAHEHDGLLLSARTGAPLAYRAGNAFYDLESDRPLYIEDSHAALVPAAARDGIVE